LSTSNSDFQVELNRLWRWLGVLVWISVAMATLVHFHDRLYSTSIDVGLHGTLVARLMESSNLPTVDENLGMMATYPRIAHGIAAAVGAEVDSALEGMQYIAYLSVFLLWSAIGFAFLRLPPRTRLIAFSALAMLLLANRQWFGLEIFGSEMVATYFYAHFVAQALALCLLVCALQLEWRKPDSIEHLLVLGLGGALLTSVHLLPAIELIGTLGVLLLLSAITDSREKRTQRLLAGAGITLFSLGLMVVNPDFLAMYRVSSNNGLMLLRYIHSIRSMSALAVGVALLSLGLIALWWRKQKGAVTYEGLLLKYFGAFGLAISGLCVIQIALLVGLSKGSEYACFKYATALQSMLVFDFILLVAQLGKDRLQSTGSGPGVFAPSGLALLACLCVFSNGSFILTGKIVSAEREARAFAKSAGLPAPGTHDFAIGIAEIGGIGNYLVSRFSLVAPALDDSFEILQGKFPKDATRINRILSSSGSDPWDTKDCRRGTAGSLIVLDGDCAYAGFTTLNCGGVIEFASRGALDKAISGLSKAEVNGRWSEGSTATLTCKTDGNYPRMAYLQATGLVTETHRQRMTVRVNSGDPQSVEFNAQSPSQRVGIALPRVPSAQLVFHFSFPDAIAPNALGVNSDLRTLGVFMYSLSFADD